LESLWVVGSVAVGADIGVELRGNAGDDIVLGDAVRGDVLVGGDAGVGNQERRDEVARQSRRLTLGALESVDGADLETVENRDLVATAVVEKVPVFALDAPGGSVVDQTVFIEADGRNGLAVVVD
jgi:hypothetical protein